MLLSKSDKVEMSDLFNEDLRLFELHDVCIK